MNSRHHNRVASSPQQKTLLGDVRKRVTQSALSWFGSDSEVAADLAAMLDHCSHVTIPFVGGASIIPHLKAGVILAADLHDQAINFYRVISGEYGTEATYDLVHRCKNTLNHPAEMALSRELSSSTSPVHRAWAFWAHCWLARKGQGGTKKHSESISVRYGPGGGDNASRITAVAEDMRLWAAELKRCSFSVMDFRELLPKVHDHPKGGIYCDYVWVSEGKNYLHSATPRDHRYLAALLHRFEQTTVVIRYGDDPLIRELYQQPRWTWIDAASRTQSNAVRSEVWITNRAT
jgi:site-specific DNA-adenine methylase